MVAKDEGLGVQLLCSASGSPQPKITWLKMEEYFTINTMGLELGMYWIHG